MRVPYKPDDVNRMSVNSAQNTIFFDQISEACCWCRFIHPAIETTTKENGLNVVSMGGSYTGTEGSCQPALSAKSRF